MNSYFVFMPDCFSRGLLRESMGQLAGLKRRKLALEMLGAAVQAGLNSSSSSSQLSESNAGIKSDDNSNKRQRSSMNEHKTGASSAASSAESQENGPPLAKKTKTEAS